MYRLIIIILTFSSLIILIATAFAASPAKEINEGNRYYKQGDYDKALEKYEAAWEATPDFDIVNLNKGAAYYQKGQYQEAIDAFTRALNTEDSRIEADSIYNIANSKYKLGSVNADNDINSAVSLYRESLDYYKRAIELDEGNSDAKYNHELVERELKVLLDKLKNQEQQQDDQKKEQDNDKKEEQKSNGGQSKSNESQEEEKQQGRETRNDQEMKEEEGGQDRPGGEDTGQEQVAGKQEGENGRMSPEEARMLLEAFGEEEARDAVKKQEGAHYPEVLKDW